MSTSRHGAFVRFYVSAGLGVAVAVNSAALVGLLSQSGDIGPVPDVAKGLAVLLWSMGLLVSAAGWLVAFVSAWAYSKGPEPAGETWAWLASLAVSVAIGCFVWGNWIIEQALAMSPD